MYRLRSASVLMGKPGPGCSTIPILHLPLLAQGDSLIGR
jgi:hypothetical protein